MQLCEISTHILRQTLRHRKEAKAVSGKVEGGRNLSAGRQHGGVAVFDKHRTSDFGASDCGRKSAFRNSGFSTSDLHPSTWPVLLCSPHQFAFGNSVRGVFWHRSDPSLYQLDLSTCHQFQSRLLSEIARSQCRIPRWCPEFDLDF